MRESAIEKYLVLQCRNQGILCYKFSSPAKRAVPDRIVIYKGQVHFVELKAPGKEPTLLQVAEHMKMRSHKMPVWVIDSKEGVHELIGAIDVRHS